MSRVEVILFSFNEEDAAILGDTLGDTELSDLLLVELQLFFRSFTKYLSDTGLIYSSTLDAYIYVFKLDSTTYLLSVHNITASISFYYNTPVAAGLLEEIRASMKEGDYKKHQFLSTWPEILQKLTPDALLNLENEEYYDDLMDLLFDTFQENLKELFYAFLFQIPTFIKVTSYEEIDSFTRLFKVILPYLRMSSEYSSEEFFHVYFVNSFPKPVSEEYLMIDLQLRTIHPNFTYTDLDPISEIIEESILFHEERIMPFHIAMYSNLFWNVQKIYGILAISRGKVDFSQYLHDDKIQFRGILHRLYQKMAFLKSYTVDDLA